MNVNTLKNLGERLKYIRKKNGYTQESLAKKIGVSRGVIYNMESNKNEPQEVVINAICQSLKINKEWLLNGSGDIYNIDKSESDRILSELNELVNTLSKDEQLYILDTIKSLKYHLKRQ